MTDESQHVCWSGSDAEWFARTGHCGYCGGPGDYCTCTERDPCNCQHLHILGSARITGALDAFQVGLDGTISEEQGELFG